MHLARNNPFSTDRVLRQRYRISEREWEKLYETLTRHRGRGALVGPKGFGKTTLLEDLAVRLRSAGKRVILTRLRAETPCLPDIFNANFCARLTPSDAVLLDGAEQLSLMRWLMFRWLTRRAGIVVVTTHRVGRLPVLRRCLTSPALLCELVSSLGQSLDADEARALYARHQGNLREALRELYDQYAEKSANALSLPASRV
jgi:hypothetical protein